jgi:polyphosphate kinase 2 (PPK2 family)
VEKFIPAGVIEKRYKIINDFEKLLEDNDTVILKFFMNVSKEAQKGRLMERIEMKEKHWKHKDGDWDTREKFDEYLAVYEKLINTCNTIPWHIVPSDKNWQKLYYIGDVVLKTLEEIDLKWPALVTEKFKSTT